MNETDNKSQENGGESCVFCKIAHKEIPAQIVYEDKETLAFMDIHPVYHGHVLVIPKDHFENIYTLPQELLCRMIMTVQKLSVAVKNAAQADGLTITMNTEAACHMKEHAHIHIIPRNEKDGWEWPTNVYIGDEIEDAAKKVKKELKS